MVFDLCQPELFADYTAKKCEKRRMAVIYFVLKSMLDDTEQRMHFFYIFNDHSRADPIFSNYNIKKLSPFPVQK